jgi:hypothetical protein
LYPDDLKIPSMPTAKGRGVYEREDGFHEIRILRDLSVRPCGKIACVSKVAIFTIERFDHGDELGLGNQCTGISATQGVSCMPDFHLNAMEVSVR